MGVQCQILINKTKEGVYRAGGAVSGQVKYCVDEPTEYQHVTLSLIGKGKCVWKSRRKEGFHRAGSPRSQRANNSRVYRGTEEYITHHVNICNKKPEDTITLHGEYQYPFEFFLPEDIPRSYKDSIASITYHIQLKFEKPSFFSFNKVFQAEIPVYSYIQPNSPEGPVIFGLRKTLFKWFSIVKPVVNLKAEISKTVLMPGENIHLTYVVTNETDVEIASVRTDLYCYIKYTANCGATNNKWEKVNSCMAETEGVPARGVRQFSIILPTLPELYSIQLSKVISKEYRVCAMVILPMPHVNPTVELPVLIGELKGSINPTLEEEDTTEPPPSYWEAMCEDEKEDKDKEKE